MRWVSSKESVAKGEVSVLAIVETLCAIALVFYLSSHFNTLRWLAIAMCVSPLLLLRTEVSTRLAIDWFDQIIPRLSAPHGFLRDCVESSLFLFSPVLGRVNVNQPFDDEGEMNEGGEHHTGLFEA